ncbi:MAG: class I SAM-dependent methyltransferase [Chloroflexi bacterium]|nr:class I SAM-dependent methyltransferase [Chloroflexota bacterium]
MAFFTAERCQALERLFAKSPGRRILNCGSGSGYWMRALAARGYKMVGLDISPAAHQLAQMNARRFGLPGAFVLGGVHRLPFRDGTFDGVISFGLLEHFASVEPVIAEMARVLRPGGVFVADVITRRWSVHSLEKGINFLHHVAGRTLRLRWRRLPECVRLLREGFYENSLSWRVYTAAMERAGLMGCRVFGVRAFPLLQLPGALGRGYARLVRRSQRWWRQFDSSGSALSLAWGAIWAFTGMKGDPAGRGAGAMAATCAAAASTGAEPDVRETAAPGRRTC